MKNGDVSHDPWIVPSFSPIPATKGDLKANLFAVEGDLRTLRDAVKRRLKKFAPPPLPWCGFRGVPMVSIVKLPPIAGWFISWKIQPKSHMRTMVLEYAHQHLPHKSPSYVGKYTSTMEHMGMDQACLDFGPVRLWFSCKSWWVGWKNLGIESTVHTRPGKHTKSYGKSTHF